MKYAKVLGLAALAVAFGCTDGSKETGPTGTQPDQPSFGNFPVTGAVFTSTNPALDDPNPSPSDHDLCTNAKDFNGPANNCNLYRSKNYVWLSGGPGPSHLDEGTYFFAVLVPGGQGGNDNPNDCTEKNLSDDPTSALPCTSSNTGAGDTWQHRVFDVDGDGIITYPSANFGSLGDHDFDLPGSRADNPFGMIRLMPYDNTTNPGGEYVMAVCNLHDATDTGNPATTDTPPGVDPSDCKYDNFKALINEDEECIIPELCQGTVTVDKFYDSNGDGIKQNTEALITWDMLIDATTTLTTPISVLPLGFGNHTVEEGIPATPANTFWYISHKDVDGGTNLIASPISLALASIAQLTADISLDAGSAASVLFGNYCTIRPGGRTMGFWSNKNGQALITITGAGNDLAGLVTTLNLRNANGTDFNPASKTAYKNWLLSATATNMSYMLSAQMSATFLSVRHGFSDPSIIVDGTRTVAQEMDYANSLLTDAIDPPIADGKNYTPSGDALRAEQERVKNILDKINNNGGLGDFTQTDVASCGTRTPYTFRSLLN